MTGPSTLPNTPLLLTGGTGTLGRLLLARLQEAGTKTRVLSRNRYPDEADVEYTVGDLDTGQGVGSAVAGCEVVIHCAGTAKGDAEKAANLIDAAKREGARHIMFISVVGADKVPISSGVDRAMFGYYGEKLRAEQTVAGSGIPWTTLRATQFHSLLLTTIRGMTKSPIVPIPKGVRFQPIDAAEVADRMLELASGPPAGLVSEMGGPHVHSMSELVRSYLDAVGKRRLTMNLAMPGGAAQAIRDGANLAPSHAVGQRTWEEFLVAVPAL